MGWRKVLAAGWLVGVLVAGFGLLYAIGGWHAVGQIFALWGIVVVVLISWRAATVLCEN